MTKPRNSDYAWTALAVGAIAYEGIAFLRRDDLLSDGTDRYRRAHPILLRLLVAELAGHFGGMLPHQLDIFNPRNVIHRNTIGRYSDRR